MDIKHAQKGEKCRQSFRHFTCYQTLYSEFSLRNALKYFHVVRKYSTVFATVNYKLTAEPVEFTRRIHTLCLQTYASATFVRSYMPWEAENNSQVFRFSPRIPFKWRSSEFLHNIFQYFCTEETCCLSVEVTAWFRCFTF